MIKPSRERFDVLRARYAEADRKFRERDVALSVKYGSCYQKSWLSADARERLERASALRDRAGGAFFTYLQRISPRDWGYGVPVHWLYEELSYDDAVRPADEKLSVSPPLAYGAATPRT